MVFTFDRSCCSLHSTRLLLVSVQRTALLRVEELVPVMHMLAIDSPPTRPPEAPESS